MLFVLWTIVQLLSHVWLFATTWIAAHQGSRSSTISLNLLKYIHWIDDAIQPSHPLSPPPPPAFNLSQHQGLFQCVDSSHQVAKGLELQLQHVFPMNSQGWFTLGLTALISLLFKELSRVFFYTTGQKHQFFSARLSLWSNSHIHTWLLEKP